MLILFLIKCAFVHLLPTDLQRFSQVKKSFLRHVYSLYLFDGIILDKRGTGDYFFSLKMLM